MNKKSIIYLLLACAVFGGGYFLITAKKDKKEADKPNGKKDMPVPAQAIIANLPSPIDPLISQEALTQKSRLKSEVK